MKRILTVLLAACILAAMLNPTLADDNWPQFRGLHASGIGSGNPPTEWDVKSGKNIGWKVPIEGLGHSAPVVWNDRVFLTTAVPGGSDKTGSEKGEPEKATLKTGWLGGTGDSAKDVEQWTWRVICVDLKTGKELWNKQVHSGKPEVKRHLKASHANCTPATDGKHVVAFFGSEGLYCFDFDGNLKWKKDFGRLHCGSYNMRELEWGFASSPVIHKHYVVLQCDCLNTGFVSILDLANGKEVRRIKRSDVATWSTPCVLKAGGKTQIVCNGFKEMASYDFETGERLWTLSGGGDVPVPAPLFFDDIFLITNGHRRSPIYAISATARGDVTPNNESEELPEGLVWHQPRDGSYMPTPIIVDGLLYNCNDNGVLVVRDAKSGEKVYKKRVSTGTNNFTASAVATSKHLYFCSEKGNVIVVKTGKEFEEIADNDMGAVVMATPAIAGDRMLIRTVDQLFCIGASARR